VQAGRYYEAAEDWGKASEAYDRGRAFASAAGIWERLGQAGKAARLYEQASEWSKAAEMNTRISNHAKAATLFQKGRQEIKAAEAYERAGEIERAAILYAKYEVFDRAGEILYKLGHLGEAANLFERSLARLRLRQDAERTPEGAEALQVSARRCADLYARAGQASRAGAILQDHGLEVEAAKYYCQAGNWELGVRLFLRHQQFDQAIAACQAPGAETWLHVVQGEWLAARGREEEAARQFEAGQMWWRAAELYDRAGAPAKAAEMYARQGDEERAAEMHAAAGDLVQAAAALERLGKWQEAARFYEEAGQLQPAAKALQAAGDVFGAGRLLLRVKDLDGAMMLLQQVGPESDRYLEATIALGDLFLERNLDGPAREKFEKAVALRPIAPDFIHPTYQLAAIYERQGNPKEALRLFEAVMAEQFDYEDVQERVTDLRRRVAQATQVQAGGDMTQVVSAPVRARYRIAKELGRGGMGIVYLAEDEVLQRQVAYKVMPDSIHEDPKGLEYFLREARIAASLQHPNIVTIYDAGQIADEVYIAMEYIEGRSLQEILDEVSMLPLPRTLAIIRQACLGLIHAHKQNIVHRDIKPANMMITAAGAVKLMDFGLAAVLTQATARVSSVRGTPFYMAPEQIMGEDISALSDQYSLGCTLYHMVTGQPPFVEGDVLYHHIHSEPVSPRERNPKVPVWLDAIILRSMVKVQTNRFPSVAVFLQELDRCLAAVRSGSQAREPSSN
jgi:eukaryotic-like serine/threonine-protein kinase